MAGADQDSRSVRCVSFIFLKVDYAVICAVCAAWYGGGTDREPSAGWLVSFIYSKSIEK